MNSNKKQLMLFYLFIDLFVLNGSVLFLAHVYPDIRSLSFQQMLSIWMILNVSFILTFFKFSKKWFYLRTDFSCHFEKIALRFLTYFLISFITVLFFLPGDHHLFFFKHSALFFTGITFNYWLIHKYFIFKRAVEFNVQRVAIVSKCKTGLMIEKIIKSNPSLGYKFVGFLSKDKSEPEKDILGSLLDLEKLINLHRIQSIISVQNFDQFLVSTCDKYGVRLGIVPKSEKTNRNNAKYTTGIEILRIHEIPLDNTIFRIVKRSFDIVFSLGIVVFVLSWLIPVMALIIKIT